MMKSCWRAQAKDRPKFKAIIKYLTQWLAIAVKTQKMRDVCKVLDDNLRAIDDSLSKVASVQLRAVRVMCMPIYFFECMCALMPPPYSNHTLLPRS